MRILTLTFLVSSSLVAQAAASDLPSWITTGPVSDSSFHYVVCSHDGIDPEEARQIAESKCLASAAKLGGVNVRLTQKTVQSLTGSDSSEVAEIQPLETKIKCEWTDRFLEKIKDGFRIWLRCKVDKSSIFKPVAISEQKKENLSVNRYAEAILILTTIPRADRIVVIGRDVERVIEADTNVVSIKISNLDEKIEISKAGFKNANILLPKKILHGSKIQKDIVLDKN